MIVDKSFYVTCKNIFSASKPVPFYFSLFFLNSYRFLVTFNLYKYFMNLTVPLTHLGTQHTMCNSNCYQRRSWENGPSDNKVLVYHHKAGFDCECSDMSIISWLPRRVESHKPWLSFPTEGITKKDQVLNDPELLLSI